jgi:hypothetical protein
VSCQNDPAGSNCSRHDNRVLINKASQEIGKDFKMLGGAQSILL